MRRLDVHSETFAGSGGIAGEGALNLLGRPPIDPLTVMLREAVQNSWDARLGDSISFAIDVMRLRGERLQVLKGDVFGVMPVVAGAEIFRSAQSWPRTM